MTSTTDVDAVLVVPDGFSIFFFLVLGRRRVFLVFFHFLCVLIFSWLAVARTGRLSDRDLARARGNCKTCFVFLKNRRNDFEFQTRLAETSLTI